MKSLTDPNIIRNLWIHYSNTLLQTVSEKCIVHNYDVGKPSEEMGEIILLRPTDTISLHIYPFLNSEAWNIVTYDDDDNMEKFAVINPIITGDPILDCNHIFALLKPVLNKFITGE